MVWLRWLLISAVFLAAGGCGSLPLQPDLLRHGSAPFSGKAQSSFSASADEKSDVASSTDFARAASAAEATSGNDMPREVAGSPLGFSPSQTAHDRPDVPSGTVQWPSPVSINLLVEELEAEGVLTSETRAQLIEDLCRTPPQLWPAVVEFFRASVELRKRRGQTVGGISPDKSLSETATAGSPATVIRASLSCVPSQPASEPRSGVVPATSEQVNSPVAPESTTRLLSSPDQSNAGTPSEAAHPQMPKGLQSVIAEGNDRGVSSPAVGEVAITDGLPQRPETGGAHGGERASSGWKDNLRQARATLSGTLPRDMTDEVRLRLLDLMLGDRQSALQPVPGVSPALQEFWSETLFSLALLYDPDLNPEPQLRLAEARRHLQAGLRRLAEECPLEVTGLAFVSSVQSWGVYEGFDKYEFTPGQKVLLYAEVENLSAESTPKGYRTAWRSSYQILDSTGKEVARYEYPPNEEYCRRPRRDFFIGCELSFPRDAAPGRYILRLTVVDLLTNRLGHGTIEFTLRTKGGN